MDLTALYGMQQPSFLPYLSAYHPYNNFPIASYQSYFRFRNYYLTSQFTVDPYFAFNYYECLDAKDLYASLFGKHCHLLSRALYAYGRDSPRSRLHAECVIVFLRFADKSYGKFSRALVGLATSYQRKKKRKDRKGLLLLTFVTTLQFVISLKSGDCAEVHFKLIRGYSVISSRFSSPKARHFGVLSLADCKSARVSRPSGRRIAAIPN